jgi:Bifunctional DNA primase/polymerase, N-terminal
MAARMREDDHRSEEELAEAGRTAARNHFAIAWTDGINGAGAKRCSRTGAAAWKRAAVLEDEEYAAELFVRRCRTRNPVVVASRSNLVLLEVDGPLELLERHGIELPETLTVRSARGWHFYFVPPSGEPPLKIQVDASGIVVSEDGYLVCPPALHPTGHEYGFEGEPWSSS